MQMAESFATTSGQMPTPVSATASTTTTADIIATTATTTATASVAPTIQVDRDDVDPGSSSLSLWSNFWSQNSSTVSLGRGREVSSAPVGDAANSSAGFTQLTASTLGSRFRHRATKSTGSRVSLSSQPVLVRSYTGGDRSRTPSIAPTPRGATGANTMRTPTPLPPVEAFSFDGILRAVEPDIQDAIDGIAEIYARSRLSLADEYGAHMPPLGEITSPRIRQSGLNIRTHGLERTLTTVAEASSSSERLAGESRAGSTTSKGKGKMTAYGSLRSIISKGKSPERETPVDVIETEGSNRLREAGWAVNEDQSGRPSILLKTHSTASNQLSVNSVVELPPARFVSNQAPPTASRSATPQPVHPSIWLPWRKSWTATSSSSSQSAEPKNAESALKKVLHSKPPQAYNAG
jgi:hypothetical protein